MIHQVKCLGGKNIQFENQLKIYANRLVTDLILQTSANDRLISNVVLDKVWDYENIIEVFELQAKLLSQLAKILKIER